MRDGKRSGSVRSNPKGGEDHVEALDLVFQTGHTGESYNIGSRNEIENIDLVRKVCDLLDEMLGGDSRKDLITFVKDRPGHDRRYAIDPSHIERQLGWKPCHTFDQGLRKTVQWYLDNNDWLERCVSGEYQNYYNMMYSNR